MNSFSRRALALVAATVLLVACNVTLAPQANAARGPQTESVPTLYIDLTGTSYRTGVTSPTITSGTPASALESINGSRSHTIAGGATYEMVDPANSAHNFVDTGTTDPATGVTTYGEIRGRGNYTWQTLPNLWDPSPPYYIANWVSSMSQYTASFTQSQVSKRPYQIKLSSKHDMLGMGSAKTWVLLANHTDGSLMRNKVALDLAAEFGLAYTSQSRFVDVVINGSYRGNYLLTEKVQEGGTRVVLKNPNGVLVELDNNYCDAEPPQLRFRTSRTNTCFVLKDAFDGNIPDPDANNNVALPAEVQAGWSDFQSKVNSFESILYGSNPDWNAIKQLIDVDSFLRFYFIQEFTENPEVSKSSVYFYKDGTSDLIHAGPIWDFDSSMGNYTTTELGSNPNILYTRNISSYRSGNNWFEKLFQVPSFEAEAKSLYVRELKTPMDEVAGKIARYKLLIASSAAKNHAKYQILGDSKLFPPFMATFKSTWDAEVDSLLWYMVRRVGFLNSVYAPNATSSSDCKATTTPAAITTAGAFNSLQPCRILDTRVGNGGTGPIAADGTLALKVAGRGGIPSTGVSAVVFNVTVTSPTHNGFITAYPGGTTLPNASNLNFSPGQTVANQVTVKVGTDGVVNLHNSIGGTVHVVADVAGFFVAGTATAPGSFTALPPSRILDTREGVGATLSRIPALGSIDLQVTGAGGVPTDAGAVALNVTVVNQSAPGHLTVYPTGVSPVPNASNVNFQAGPAVPNSVTVKLGDAGKVSIVNSSPTSPIDVVADVNGYYLSGAATSPGMFVPLSPARILDSRTGVGMPKGDFKAGTARRFNTYETVMLQVAGAGGVPKVSTTAGVVNAGAVVMNITTVNPTQPGYLTGFPAGTLRPQTSTVNFKKGDVVPNLTTLKLGTNGALNIYNNNAGQVDVIADVAGYYVK
jgi:spore coat protein CotH